MSGAGHPLEDPELEKILLEFKKYLKEDKLQFVTPLLVMEALFHRPSWKGGVDSVGFNGRVQKYIQLFLTRNNCSRRVPTTIGQKLPQRWMRKWYCCSLFYYIKTEGVQNPYANNGDETKFYRCFVAKKQIADKGSIEVCAGTEGDEKDGISTFLYTDADAVPQRPFFILTGEVAPNRPQLSTSQKRKRGTVRDNIERAIQDGRLNPWHDVWVNKAGYMDTEAMMYLIKCIGTRKPRLPCGKYVLSSLLVDSHNAHKTDAVKALCDEYNILLFLIAGGLTPKANLADVEYIKSTKDRYNKQLLVMREEIYRAKRQRVTNADGLVTAKVQPPAKISTIACMNAIIDAWKGNDFSRVKKRFLDTRMLTKAQGDEVGWNPHDPLKPMSQLRTTKFM